MGNRKDGPQRHRGNREKRDRRGRRKGLPQIPQRRGSHGWEREEENRSR
jgi:hypothetical protein